MNVITDLPGDLHVYVRAGGGDGEGGAEEGGVPGLELPAGRTGPGTAVQLQVAELDREREGERPGLHLPVGGVLQARPRHRDRDTRVSGDRRVDADLNIPAL